MDPPRRERARGAGVRRPGGEGGDPGLGTTAAAVEIETVSWTDVPLPPGAARAVRVRTAAALYEALLRASHAKPWKDSSDAEHLDVYNGLLLAVHLDALFDRGIAHLWHHPAHWYLTRCSGYSGFQTACRRYAGWQTGTAPTWRITANICGGGVERTAGASWVELEGNP